jgi:aminopeptidase
MDKANKIEEYAKFAVAIGINLQEGCNLMINTPIETAEFARKVATAAYDLGAREVVINYKDELFSRIKMERTDISALSDFKIWQLERYMEYYRGEGKLSVLNIYAEDPEIYKGIDANKLSISAKAAMKAMKPWREITMANKVQWSIISVPTASWAKKVFPEKSESEAIESLWDEILKACRIDEKDPISAWKDNLKLLQSYKEKLNNLKLVELHLKSDNGTNAVIGLADNHIFQGGSQVSSDGIEFLPNIPTEEVFTAPHLENVDGVIKSSMPYVYHGNLIDGIEVEFKKGKVVRYTAKHNKELLTEMFSSDEGAARIGEIALVPKTSPIRKSGILFYNTLFDENAACHIAFGAGYPDNISGGEGMDRAKLKEKGLNDSLIHEDIMIGTKDMNIIGVDGKGNRYSIFKDGDWDPEF